LVGLLLLFFTLASGFITHGCAIVAPFFSVEKNAVSDLKISLYTIYTEAMYLFWKRRDLTIV